MTIITSIEDLRVLAKKRVPRMFYDYADAGSWTESTYRANNEDFSKIKFRQRVAVNLENRTLASTMVGQNVTMPVALAPTGLTGMQHADGEILAAKQRLDLDVDLHGVGQRDLGLLGLQRENRLEGERGHEERKVCAIKEQVELKKINKLIKLNRIE